MKWPSGTVVGVFGLPCTGKTTVIRTIMGSTKEVVAYISSGDIARRLSTEADKKHMSDGSLFPHEDTLRAEIYETIQKRRSSGAELVFLDGFPRFSGQCLWLLENQLIGPETGFLVQIMGDKNLVMRAKLRMRDDHDDPEIFDKRVVEQSKKIYEMEKLIGQYGISYYCVPNTDLEIAVKTLVKYLGLRK